MHSLLIFAGVVAALTAIVAGVTGLRAHLRARAERDRILRNLEARVGDVLGVVRRTEVAHASLEHKLAFVHGELDGVSNAVREVRGQQLRRQDFEETMTSVGHALHELLARPHHAQTPAEHAPKRPRGRSE